MSEDHVKLTVRLPARLHKALKERAVEYNVSLNQAVVNALAANVTGEPHEETEKEKVVRALREAGKLSDPGELLPWIEGVEPATLEEAQEWLKGVPLSEWIIEGSGAALMPAYYLDASALAKRYLPEPGTLWLNQLLDEETSHLFLSSELALVEVVSALSRAQREKRISATHRNRLINQVNVEMQQLMRVLSASRLVVQTAGGLVVRHPLRAYDAIHLATALDLANDLARLGMGTPVLVSADVTLLAAARAEGLPIENPNDHP